MVGPIGSVKGSSEVRYKRQARMLKLGTQIQRTPAHLRKDRNSCFEVGGERNAMRSFLSK